MAEWVCAKCGKHAPAHSWAENECIWEPVLRDDKEHERLEKALLIGAQIREVDSTLAEYRIAWGNYTPDPHDLGIGLRNLDYLDSVGFNSLSDHREKLRKQLFDLFDVKDSE